MKVAAVFVLLLSSSAFAQSTPETNLGQLANIPFQLDRLNPNAPERRAIDTLSGTALRDCGQETYGPQDLPQVVHNDAQFRLSPEGSYESGREKVRLGVDVGPGTRIDIKSKKRLINVLQTF